MIINLVCKGIVFVEGRHIELLISLGNGSHQSTTIKYVINKNDK